MKDFDLQLPELNKQKVGPKPSYQTKLKRWNFVERDDDEKVGCNHGAVGRAVSRSWFNWEEKPRPFLIFCLLQTLSASYWSLLNYFFLPAIQANLVFLPFSPVCYPAISAKKFPPDLKTVWSKQIM